MFTHYQDHIGSNSERFFKSTLFQSSHLLLGLNCLEPGQSQSPHTHTEQDKFYFVLEGEGRFTVGDVTKTVNEGFVILAPAGVEHGVTNIASARLVILVGIAPGPH